MTLTKANIKKVIEDNFSDHVDLDFVGIKKGNGSFHVLSKPQGLNAIVDDLPNWESSLISHIKWQLYI